MAQPNEPPPRPDVIIVVPCYNESRRLNSQAFSELLDASPNVAILFVDDGSTDDTPLVMERIRQQHSRQVFTLRLSANVGKAEAVRRGALVALRRRPAFVGYWDADLATPLAAVSQLWATLNARPGVQLVVGSRVAMLGREIRRSTVRHFLGRAFATAASAVLRMPVYDTQCGAKLFRVTAQTAPLFAEPFCSRWVFDVEILARLQCSIAFLASTSSSDGMVYEVPLDQWRDVNGSRLRPRDFLVAALDLARIYWCYKRRATADVQQVTKEARALQDNHREAA